MHDLNRYDQQEPVGSGGFADVYRAFDPLRSEYVALKRSRIDADCVARTKREIEVQRLDLHGNVMRVLDWAEDGSWFTMPLANGDLGLMHERAPLKGPQILRFVEDVASALDVAHRRGFVHRDLSPANVLWLIDRWVVADWGFVKGTAGGARTKLTRTGVGTALFTAPEVYLDGNAATAACDVYSLGRLVAWLLNVAPLEQNRETTIDDGSPWAPFVRATTKLDQAERPQSIAQALTFLASAVDTYGGGAHSPPDAPVANLPDVADATVKYFKRLLQEPARKIDLEDLLDREVEAAYARLSPAEFPVQASEHGEALESRLRRYVAACSSVLALLMNGVAYGADDNARLWTQAVRRLGEPPGEWAGYPDLLKLRRFPVTLVLYSSGLVAVARGAWRNLHAIAVAPTLRDGRHEELELAVAFASAASVAEQGLMQSLPKRERNFTPLSDWLFEALREPARRFIRSDDDYETTFDRLELLLAMLYVGVSGTGWVPPGRFAWKDPKSRRLQVKTQAEALKEEIQAQGDGWGPVAGRLFPDAKAAVEAIEAVDKFTRGLNWGF